MIDCEKEFKRVALGIILVSSFSILLNIFSKKTCSSVLSVFSELVFFEHTISLIIASSCSLTALKLLMAFSYKIMNIYIYVY